jgi:hypothetical protein
MRSSLLKEILPSVLKTPAVGPMDSPLCLFLTDFFSIIFLEIGLLNPVDEIENEIHAKIFERNKFLFPEIELIGSAKV